MQTSSNYSSNSTKQLLTGSSHASQTVQIAYEINQPRRLPRNSGGYPVRTGNCHSGETPHDRCTYTLSARSISVPSDSELLAQPNDANSSLSRAQLTIQPVTVNQLSQQWNASSVTRLMCGRRNDVKCHIVVTGRFKETSFNLS